MSPNHHQFAAFITERRKARGLTMPALAELVGTTKSNVHAWESGEWLPRVSVLEPLARALKVSYEDLYVLAGYAYPKGLPGTEPYLRALYPGVSKKRLAEAKRLFAAIDAEEAARPKRSKRRRA